MRLERQTTVPGTHMLWSEMVEQDEWIQVLYTSGGHRLVDFEITHRIQKGPDSMFDFLFHSTSTTKMYVFLLLLHQTPKEFIFFQGIYTSTYKVLVH